MEAAARITVKARIGLVCMRMIIKALDVMLLKIMIAMELMQRVVHRHRPIRFAVVLVPTVKLHLMTITQMALMLTSLIGTLMLSLFRKPRFSTDQSSIPDQLQISRL